MEQFSKATSDSSSLLGTVLSADPAKGAYVGGFRTGALALTGWQWVDGTNPLNLNMGFASGPWRASDPA